MGILIDTNVFIDAERGRLDLKAHLREHGQEEPFISVITVSELLHGFHRTTSEKIRDKRLAYIEGILSETTILQVDMPTARRHARLWADLESRGLMIGAHDLWLAATGLAHQLTLITANTREFERIPELRIENWRDDQA